MFYKCMNSKRRAKENVYPLLDAVGNMTTEVKEKAEVLSTFFTFAFNCQTSYPKVLSLLTWKSGLGNRINHPQFRCRQRPSTPLDFHKSV